MPEKSKDFYVSKFPEEMIKNAINLISGDSSSVSQKYIIKYSDETWTYESINEFLAEYRKDIKGAEIRYSNTSNKIFIFFYKEGITHISFSSTNRDEIIDVFEVFESKYDKYKIKPELVEKNNEKVIKNRIKIFLGHGRSTQWRDLKDHLQDKHGYKVIAYETGARAGYTISEVLSELSASANIAFLVHTAEDQDKNELFHARENVIHETGLFQGVLGLKRAIILLEEGTQEYTNISGVQQIRYTKGNIKEVFGEVLAIIRREFNEENDEDIK
ncbi:TIR domain-containing protein [Paenibacillus sp. Dod16]|uniref:TIR domain-containing protein n=1 Tax=Paenibacillus sp. Dod16 TaxID=3416392 RepID=UPI003CF3CD5F